MLVFNTKPSDQLSLIAFLQQALWVLCVQGSEDAIDGHIVLPCGLAGFLSGVDYMLDNLVCLGLYLVKDIPTYFKLLHTH